MAAVRNFSDAVAVRFFLGVFEAAVTPGFALFTSQCRCTPYLDRAHCTNNTRVHEKGARYPHWHLVWLQWMGADFRWPRCIWHCSRNGYPRFGDRSMEDSILGHWAFDDLYWGDFSICDAR